MRAAGVEFVEVLGCGIPEDECEACRAAASMTFEIDFAPELPLPGCDLKYCKCVLVAAKGPRQKDAETEK